MPKRSNRCAPGPVRPRVGGAEPSLLTRAGTRRDPGNGRPRPKTSPQKESSLTPFKMAKTPVVASKKSAKVAKAAAAPKKDGKKKRSTKRVESYGIYIYKVLKQVHPGEFQAGSGALAALSL